jgi:hypothetical protein
MLRAMRQVDIADSLVGLWAMTLVKSSPSKISRKISRKIPLELRAKTL